MTNTAAPHNLITYKVIFDDSADMHSSKSRSVTVTAANLATKITSLQGRGMIITSVQKIS